MSHEVIAHADCLVQGSVYLDHAGTTLYSKSLMDGFAKDMTSNLFGNPHSASLSSQLSTSRIEDIRLRVLQFFNADPTEFDVVFVANATAGIKLVAEAFRAALGGFDYAYHQTSHTSLIGVREEARNSLCLDDAQMDSWLGGLNPFEHHSMRSPTTLFAYPAQSNMDGQRLPFSWSTRLRQLPSSGNSFYTVLDAAAFAATAPLDLSDFTAAPDFTVVSFYKIFGFPDLGALIVRRQSESIFSHRRYFGGGTVDTVVCVKEQWHASKSQFLHERLEDGTLPIHSIIALDVAMDTHRRLFGTMNDISSHVAFLANRLHTGLAALRHRNRQHVCRVYSPSTSQVDPTGGNGPTVSFNILNQTGAWISLAEFEKLATLKGFHIRTGGVCNPGGIASALDLQPWEIKRNFSSGFRCGDDNDIIAGKPTGVIRASLGAMSTISDVDSFVTFIDEFYRDDTIVSPVEELRHDHRPSDLYVKSITVYPIKSCGGFQVPEETKWEVRPEGLAWDREWCLVHRGTGQALSQKRYPRMSLIRPILDFEEGCLRVTYAGDTSKQSNPGISVPLSNNPAMFQQAAHWRSRSSRVCGEEISAQTYISPEINDFFSAILEVPCMLARFPPGGQGPSMRHSKAHLQKHQAVSKLAVIPSAGTGHAPPSPPDSDAESERRRILLSNESPILVVNTASLEFLNQEISSRGGEEVSASVFRANIVLAPDGAPPQGLAYAEDSWSTLRIGQQEFKMLGSCRRCHMVCINQETGLKNEEPFITLSKTRRFDGKVFFGTHMGHTPSADIATKVAQHPTIKVGDAVVATF